MEQVAQSTFDFLKTLQENNNRVWFDSNKELYKAEELKLKSFFLQVKEDLNTTDSIEKMKIFRIYKDVRFSKNKTPYNIHRSVGFSRATDSLRGSYYLRIEPGNSMLAVGFFQPNPADLLRIRKEFEMDAFEMREILAQKKVKELFGGLQGSEVKTAPRGFDKTHADIDLIRKKSFLFSRSFTDAEVMSENFGPTIKESFEALRPFLDYMSDVLTTDLNGVSILNKEL